MNNKKIQKHVYPIIDIMIEDVCKDLTEEGQTISCKAGCNHCCHLLVEISMLEAEALAEWITNQPEDKQIEITNKIKENSDDIRALFSKTKVGRNYLEKFLIEEKQVASKFFDQYFYGKKRPCPFLSAEGCCSAYEVRPTSCRVHMVVSPAELCKSDIEDDTDYEVPARVDQLRKEIGPINSAVTRGLSWGPLGLMVEAALNRDNERD